MKAKKKLATAKKASARKKKIKPVKKIGKKMSAKKSAFAKKPSTGKKSVKKVPQKNSTFKVHVTKLKAGEKAPFFVGQDQDGNQVSLNDFTGKTLVLYFYPKDDTSGCTAESCSLRDEYQYLTKENYAIVGVSADDIKSHKKFAEKFSLPFPLIADTNKDIIKDYDVWGKKMLYGRIYDGIVRTTFLIKDGFIQSVITNVDTVGHGKQVMEG